MKKITLALVILAAIIPETNARPSRGTNAPFREICAALNAAISTGTTSEFCGDITNRFEGLPSFASSVCEDSAAQFSADPDNGPTYCHSQFRNIQTSREPVAFLTAMSNVVELPNLKMRQSRVAEECDNQFMCTFNSDLVLPDYLNYKSLMRTLNRYAPPVQVTSINLSEQKCTCLEDSIQQSNTALGVKDFENSLNQEKKRINDLIFDAVGKKLINDLAANLEDLNFFHTNNTRTIGGEAGRNQVSCNDFSAFRTTIMDQCRRNGIEAGVAEQRMTTLMNSFGDLGRSSDAESLFNRLNNDIMNYQVDPSQVFPGRQGTFTRQQYDRFRFGVYKTQPEVKFMNDIIDLFMDDEVLGPQILSGIESGEPPGKVIGPLLKDKSNEHTRRIFTRYLRRNKDTTFHRNLKAALDANADDAFSDYIMATQNIAFDMHPGLKAIFKDKDLFLSTRERMHTTGEHSFIDAIETLPGSLVNYFKERCDQLKTNFAEAACVPNEDFISRADRNDLVQLLSTVKDLNLPLSELILCKMETPPPGKSIFKRLAFKPHERLFQADYFLMKVNPQNASASRFGQVALSLARGDEKTFRALTKIASSGDAFRIPAPEVLAQERGTKALPKQETSVAALNDLLQKSQEQVQERAAPVPQQTSYMAPVPTTVTTKGSANAPDSNPRNMLKDFLANKENEQEVERLLSNTSREDHEELIRLRREVQESRERMRQLLEETERNKLDNLRADYERLEREVNSPSQDRRVQEPGESDISETRTTSVVAPVQNVVRVPDAAEAAGGGSTSTSSGGSSVSGSGAGVNRSIASDESVIATAPSQGPSILIESSGIQGNSPEGRAQISEEVIAYLQNSSPDLDTLKKLKESGIIIKYKVIEQGTEVQKEMRVSYSDLSPEARQALDRRLQMEENLVALDKARRAYSYTALKHLLGIRVQSQQE